MEENIEKINDNEFKLLNQNEQIIKLSELEAQLKNIQIQNADAQAKYDFWLSLAEHQQGFVMIDPIIDTSKLEELISKMKLM